MAVQYRIVANFYMNSVCLGHFLPLRNLNVPVNLIILIHPWIVINISFNLFCGVFTCKLTI